MRSIFVVPCLLLLAAPALAQTIYRCKGADGVTAVQSEPCTAAQRSLDVRYYDTGTASPEALQRRRQADQEMERRRKQRARPVYTLGRPATTTDSRAQQRIQCELARNNRKVTLERLGIHRTFEVLRSLNESVQQACKGL